MEKEPPLQYASLLPIHRAVLERKKKKKTKKKENEKQSHNLIHLCPDAFGTAALLAERCQS